MPSRDRAGDPIGPDGRRPLFLMMISKASLESLAKHNCCVQVVFLNCSG
jgi:hypothetical protein